MIFYFSGTGNSEHAAKYLLTEGEELISMTKAKWEEAFTYAPKENEPVGFVFPVYFYGLPDTVRTFIQNVTFTTDPAYVYTVITCGGSIGGAGNLVKKYLKENGTELQGIFSVKMPDNYVLMYDVTTEEEEKPILEAAEDTLRKIKKYIRVRRPFGTKVNVVNKAKTAMLYPFYDLSRKTNKFYTIDTCVSCGVCASRCPAKAIELIDGTPTWVKDKCDHCMSCIRCNAIQYGKRTLDKYRYKHPDLRKKTAATHDAHGDGGCCGNHGDGGHGSHADGACCGNDDACCCSQDTSGNPTESCCCEQE